MKPMWRAIFVFWLAVMISEPVAAEPETVVNSVGMAFRAIPAGSFRMGSPASEPGRAGDEALQEVILTRPFYMQQTEVTQAQWLAVMGANPSHYQTCANCPVENVSWRDVRGFIRRLNRLEKTRTYRLPTEAEWEYACRAGRLEPLAKGQAARRVCDYGPQHDSIGWCLENAEGRTHPVGRKVPNRWGLYDMHGNVWEWCADFYAQREPQATVLVDPAGPRHGWGRVFKGGAFNFTAECSRAANRKWTMAVFACRNIGFRLVKETGP